MEVKMKKSTIKRTYFELDITNNDDYTVFNIFGLNDDNFPMEIHKNNINSLREYVENYIKEYGDNLNLMGILNEIENELENVDEVQFLI
jgi:hypothetical protein